MTGSYLRLPGSSCRRKKVFNQVPLTLNQEYQSFLKGCGSAFAGYSGEGNKIRAVTRDGVFFGLFAEKHNAEGVVFRTVLKDGLSFEDGKHCIAYLTECLIRNYHPVRIETTGRTPYLICVFEANGYYAKGQGWQKIIDRQRYHLQDRAFDQEGYIINQGLTDAIPFGWFTSKDKGCGWISAFNLFKIAGCEKTISFCASGLNTFSPIGKLMGEELLQEWFWLKRQGLNLGLTRGTNRQSIEAMKKYKGGILLYTHRRGAHYVAFENIGGGKIHVWNAVYGKRDHIDTPENFLKVYAWLPFSSVLYLKDYENSH